MHTNYFFQRLVFLAALLFCFTTTSGFANHFPGSIDHSVDCNLPAPDNLTLTAVTSSSISLSWDPVAGAVGYRVRVIKTLTGQLLYTDDVTTTFDSPDLLPSGTQVTYSVAAICANGQTGAKSEGQTTTKFIIIDDIVATRPPGIVPNTPVANCSGGNTTVFVFPTSGATVIPFDMLFDGAETTPFDIVFYNGSGYDSEKTMVRHDNIEDGNDNWVFTNEMKEIPLQGQKDASSFKVYLGNGTAKAVVDDKNHVLDLILSLKPHAGGLGFQDLHVCISNVNDGAQVLYFSTLGNKPGSATTSANSRLSQHPLTLSPNPFNEVLHLTLDHTSGQHATVGLIDMQGRAVYAQSVEAGTQNVAIPTADLLPGIYMVRYETQEAVKTYKVIKVN